MRTLLIAASLAGVLATPAALLPVPAGEPHTTPGAGRLPPAAAGFRSPLAGPPEIVRPFEEPATPYGPGHRGVDLAGSPGQPVLAAEDGLVVHAGRVADRNVVSIQHPGGLRTTYEPVEPIVTAGRLIRRGQRIGHLEAGHPECTAPAPQVCLHWGLRRGSDYLDPLHPSGPARVRLLPVHGADNP